MEINFKFVPTFLGALALTALLGQPAKGPAAARATTPHAEAKRDTTSAARRKGTNPALAVPRGNVLLASQRVASPARPPLPDGDDDW